MRIPIMAGNWKMNCANDEAWELASAIADRQGAVEGCEVILCPPGTALTTGAAAIEDSNVRLGAKIASLGTYPGLSARRQVTVQSATQLLIVSVWPREHYACSLR